MFLIGYIVLPLVGGIGAALVASTLIGVSLISDGFTSSSPIPSDLSIGGIFGLLFLALLFFAFVGTFTTVLSVRAVYGKSLDFGELVQISWSYFARVIGLFILCGLALGIGFALLILPGIFVLHRVILAPYLLIDKNLSVMDAISKSNEMAAKHSGPMWGLIGVVIVIWLITVVAQIIPLIGGIIATGLTMIWSLVPALRYAQLQGKSV